MKELPLTDIFAVESFSAPRDLAVGMEAFPSARLEPVLVEASFDQNALEGIGLKGSMPDGSSRRVLDLTPARESATALIECNRALGESRRWPAFERNENDCGREYPDHRVRPPGSTEQRHIWRCYS